MKLKVGIRETTYTCYLRTYNYAVREELGKLPIAKVKHSDILSFYSSLYRIKKLSVRTIALVHVQLLMAFQLAYRDGIIVKNPLDGAMKSFKGLINNSERKIRALTIEEQTAFLKFMEKHPRFRRYHSLFCVMLGTGIRVGELCGLRWQDVDISNRVIHINHTLALVYVGRGENRLVIAPTKTKSGKRSIPIMESVVNAFIEEYKKSENKGFKSENIDGYTGFVFTSENGKAYYPSKLNCVLVRLVKAYNKQELIKAKEENRTPFFLPHISNHMLRHTFCTRLCERDVNIKVIQTLMGHSNINVTMDVYAEVSKEKQADELNKIAEELNVF